MKKRAMALALSVAMVLGSVPLSVSAEEPEVSVEVVEAEAEANEAQAGAEVTEEPAEESEEAEEIIAEPQIAVESLEQVDEPAEVTEPSGADEAAPIAEEVELGALDTPVATALNTEVELTGLDLTLKGKSVKLIPKGTSTEGSVITANHTSDLDIPWDPTDTETPGKNNGGVVLTGDGGVLGPDNYTLSYENSNKVTTDPANAPAVLTITFKKSDTYTKLSEKIVKVQFKISKVDLETARSEGKLKVTAYDLDDGYKKGDTAGKGIEYYTYDGKEHGVKSLTVTYNGVELKEKTDYTVEVYDAASGEKDNKDKKNAGSKVVNIKAVDTSNYAGQTYAIDPKADPEADPNLYKKKGIIEYEIRQRDAVTEGGIEAPDVEVLVNSSEYNSAAQSGNEKKFLKDKIMDTQVNKPLPEGTYTIEYYNINEGGSRGSVTSASTVFGPHSQNDEYFYYVYPNGTGNFAEVKSGNYPDKLQGKISIVTEKTGTLEDTFKLVKDEIEKGSYQYDGRNKLGENYDTEGTVRYAVVTAFGKIDRNFASRITVNSAEIGKDSKGNPKYEDLTNVKNGYVITISGNKNTNWEGHKVTATVNVVPANINAVAGKTGKDDAWNGNLDDDDNPNNSVNIANAIIMTDQYQNVDEKYTNHVPKVKQVNLRWKKGFGPNTKLVIDPNTKKPAIDSDTQELIYEGGGATLKEGIDFEVVVPEPAANGKIEYVTIKGINNFTSEKRVAVTQREKVNLALFKENVTVTTDANGTITSVVMKDKAGATVPSEAYSAKPDCGCDNDQHKAGKVHKIKITKNSEADVAKYGKYEVNDDGKDYFEVSFRVSEEKFADAYNVESSITTPKVDTEITGKLPHEQVVISQKANAHTFYAAAQMCNWKYVWTDPQTGETLTITEKMFAEGFSNYKKSGNNVAAHTFPEVGTWKLVLEPKDELDNGRYTGELVVEFTVGPKAFDKNTIAITNNGIDWPGKPAEAADLAEGLLVRDVSNLSEEQAKDENKGTVLTYDKDYVITSVADADLVRGNATVTLSGKEGSKYDGQTITAKVYIYARDLQDADLTVKEGALDYTGEAFTTLPSELVTVSFAKGTLVVDPSEYTITAQGTNGAVGTNVTVTVTANDYRKGFHYTGSKSTTDKITAADISHKDVFQLEGVEAQYLYDPENGAEQKDLKLKDIRTQKYIELNPQYTYVDNKKVGTAKVQVTAADSTTYKGTAEAEFQVMAPGAANVILKQDTYTYTGKAIEPEVEKVTALDGSALSSSSWTVKEYVDNVNAGRATVVVAVTVNGETLEIVKDFTISPARINASDVSDPAATYEYNGDVIRPVVTVTVNGQTLKAGTDYIVMNTESTAVGRKELAVQGKGNYTGDVLKKFEVVAASVANAKITGLNASYAYNGAVRKPAVTVTLGSKVLKKGRDYKIAYTNNANVGAKNVKVTGIGNYTGSVKTTFQVVPKKAVISKITVGKKRISVAVAAQTGAKYHIQYREAGTKKWTGVVTKNATQAISGLKSGKNYIVRVRAYKVIQGKKVLGAWSTAKATGKVK